MAIKYTMTKDGDLLLVETTGFDENLAEVQQYGLAILNACIQGNHTKVLCNEINLEYRLGTFDTFLAAEFMAAQIPKLGKAAIVCNETFIEDAKFWETVAVNRGLTVRVFKDVESARDWLEVK
jgi:hypothetical protein